MNIFVLDENPWTAAGYHCNKHVVKQIVETAQLLSNAHAPNSLFYKHTHYNHPCSKWARESRQNYEWLLELGFALCNEYTGRYHKVHKTENVLWNLKINIPNVPSSLLTAFAQCMPDQYKSADAVNAYRTYYLNEKSRFARWEPRTRTPWWWIP